MLVLDKISFEVKAGKILALVGKSGIGKSTLLNIIGGLEQATAGRQKVSLIRTLLQDPQIILLDEPFSAIDFDTRLHLVQDIRSYVISTKQAAVFVTHNIEEAITISDTVIVLGGRPAHSVWQTDISIPDGCRDPVTTRRSKDFQAYFEQIWKSMGASV